MVFNVQDYGALGDGITDDTAAIQAAIDAAAAAGGGTVQIPAGVYRVSGGEEASDGCLMLKSNVYLQGAGMGETVIKVVDGSDQKITGVIRSAYGEETHDFGVSDLTIDGNRDATTGKIDGWFNGYIPDQQGADRNVTLERVEIRDCSGYGFDPHEQTINILIKDCVSHGNGLDGFVADFMIDGAFVGNVAYDNDRHGFNVVTSTHDFVLLDNVAYGNGGNGVVVQRGSSDIPSPENILIQGGEYYDNGLEGVLIKLSSQVTVDGADIHGNGGTGVRIYGSSDVQVINSNIHGNAQNAPNPEILVQSYDDTAGVSGRFWTAQNNLIEGNTISGDGHSTYGVQERNDGTRQTGVYDNDISGTVRGETLLYGTGSVVSDEPSGQLEVILRGTDGNDVLQGGAASEQLLGLAGSDNLSGGGGDDQLEGGGGRDRLTGGEGADIFRFAATSDSYVSSLGNFSDNIGDFQAGIDRIDVNALGFTGLGGGAGQLQLVYNAAIDRTYLQASQADGAGQRFSLSLDGNHLDLTAADLILAAPVANRAPELQAPLADQLARAGAPFGLTLASTTFLDPDGDPLSYAASLGNGGSLPAWLRFDPVSLAFSGTPGGAAPGRYEIAVNVSDGRGGNGQEHFVLTVVEAGASLGDAGNNTLAGTAGDDFLYGLAGADMLSGGLGDDLLDGGSGRDRLTGGDGADLFRIAALEDSYRAAGTTQSDLIADFTPGQDRVDLSGLGFSGLGNGLDGTLQLVYSAATNRTYLRSLEGDTEGRQFELGFSGDLRASLDASDLIFVAPPAPVVGDEQGNLLSGSDQGELLLGLGGDDALDGAGGDDLLDGGAGIDRLTGGTGADTFRFGAPLESYRNYDAGGLSATDLIVDFTPGVDKIDVSALGLYGLGNGHNDTLYITLSDTGTKTYIKSAESDSDGNRFEIALEGDLTGQLGAGDFIFSQGGDGEILFIPTLGQSNARLLRIYEDDHQSGVSQMIADLQRYTDFDSVESLFYNEEGDAIDIAEGGSTVTGHSTDSAEQLLLNWWHVDTNSPGYLTLNALALLQSQLATLEERGNVTFAMIWGQGEEAAQTLVASSDQQAYLELYKSSTLKVFDYLKSQLGVPDATIYMMHTGRYQEDAAAVRGANPAKVAQIVAATELVRQAQDEMAAARDDIKIAIDYRDLPLRYEVDPVLSHDDVWHLHEESAEIVGQRLADFIAEDMGYQGDSTDNASPDDISKYPERYITSLTGATLYGSDGSETLDARNGDQLLIGGDGEDYYIVDGAGDQIIESGLDGPEIDDVQIDRVDSSVSWTLSDNLDVLTLTGNAAIDGTGNGRDNIIGGNAAANVLDGAGGVDKMLGGDGNDTYHVDNLGDRAIETEVDIVKGGTDVVIASVNYTLGANLENLVLVGDDFLSGVGNALDNTLYASNGDNQLNGSSGIDTVSYAFAQSGVSLTLATGLAQATGGSGSDVLKGFENLEGSAYADTLTGNSANNLLLGGAGDDSLNGSAGNDVLIGGAGSDTLIGGSGADRYVFGALDDLGLAELADIVSGFKAGDGDRIDFSGLDANPLTAAREAFEFIGNQDFSATDATGQLRFADGALHGSINADSAAEFTIRLLGVTEFSQNDLVG